MITNQSSPERSPNVVSLSDTSFVAFLVVKHKLRVLEARRNYNFVEFFVDIQNHRLSDLTKEFRSEAASVSPYPYISEVKRLKGQATELMRQGGVR